MTELFLIAHKVRGQPAFDVAEKMWVNHDEYWWIIPTSGHRAYPFWYGGLADRFYFGEQGMAAVAAQMPEDLQDHYSVAAKSSSGDYTKEKTLARKIPNLEEI